MEQSLTLFLDLEQGAHPDLEVVARTSLAFAEAVRETALFLDPMAQVRLELESTSASSFGINSIIKHIRDDPVLRASLLSSALMWFLTETGAFTLGQFYSAILPQTPVVATLSDEDLKRIADACQKIDRNEAVGAKRRRIFQEVEKDQSITGVGVSPDKNKKPVTIVPRAEFVIRARAPEIVEDEDERKRKQESQETLRLIRPVLLTEIRRWQFHSRYGQISANMKDERFLRDVMSGKISIPMVSGIEMDVVLETKERLNQGVWETYERNIIEVFGTRTRPTQTDLGLGPPEGSQEDDDE